MTQYREPHVWRIILRGRVFFFFDKDYGRLGKGKVEERSCQCLVNLDQQTQKEAGSLTKVTGRRRVGRETWLQEV